MNAEAIPGLKRSCDPEGQLMDQIETLSLLASIPNMNSGNAVRIASDIIKRIDDIGMDGFLDHFENMVQSMSRDSIRSLIHCLVAALLIYEHNRSIKS